MSANNLDGSQNMRNSNQLKRLDSNIMVIVDKNAQEQVKPEAKQPEYENPGLESPDYQGHGMNAGEYAPPDPHQYEEEQVIIEDE